MPRPVGVESCDELLVIELASWADPEDVSTRLSAQLPEGIQLKSAVPLAVQDRCLPVLAVHALPIDAAMLASVERSAAELMAKSTHVVERPAADGRRRKSVDIRAFLTDIRVDDGQLVWSQTVSMDGTPRVGEVLGALGLPPGDWTHRVIRRRMVCRDDLP